MLLTLIALQHFETASFADLTGAAITRRSDRAPGTSRSPSVPEEKPDYGAYDAPEGACALKRGWL
jgi:hypothetical protein